jgi:fatty acid desaturase
MTDATIDGVGTSGTFTETRTARDLFGVVDLRTMALRSDLRGAVQVAKHLGCVAATGALVWLALPHWYLLVPAMVLHGMTLVTMFAPMHEGVHRTAFATSAVNDVVAWVAGALCFYNSTYYRYYHAWHHRYTQDPARDPELMYPKAANRLAYLMEITGFTFWFRRSIDYPKLALGQTGRLPFVPENARRSVAISMSAQLLVYLVAAVSIAMGYSAALYFWFLPVILAQPVLRAILVTEHTGCSQDQNGLTNTRTTLALLPIRVLMWNMPFHAEHHLFPSVPFHRLPALHQQIRDRIAHVAPGYVTTNRAIFRAL